MRNNLEYPYPAINDYALIGDGRSAALVSSGGSLDWLCWPRFDSPSVFAAMLDAKIGGRFLVKPRGAFQTLRRYRPDTNVLETTFHTETGSVVLRDLMSIASEAYKKTALMAEHEVLRELECLSGDVEIEILYDPRPGYGTRQVPLKRYGNLGLQCMYGNGSLLLRSDIPLRIDPGGCTASGSTHLRTGDCHYLSLSFSETAPAVIPPLGRFARERIERSAAWWRSWAGQSRYEGPYRDAVMRSALALKLMVYAPSGAIIAAPTTSLPEKIGGERNWDYRYCWLRDASFTIRALLGLGFEDEATAYANWILQATRLTWPTLQVLYDVFGEANLPERMLPHLSGYAGSRPVRIGNDAHDQIQLDVYGEVLDAITRVGRLDGHASQDIVRFLDGLGRAVCERWRDPDEGIWEGRSGREHHTHSKVLCWVALDRLIDLHETRGLNLDVARYRTERQAIRTEIERHGFNERIGSYTQVFGGDEVDACLLTLPLYGYIDARHPRMISTAAVIQKLLGRGPLLYRYAEGTADGLPAGEGTFGVCGFWAVEVRAMSGDGNGAAKSFDQLVSYANDLGLLAEEIDPDTGEGLGNFPQAFTHVGLINAALTLSRTFMVAVANGSKRVAEAPMGEAI